MVKKAEAEKAKEARAEAAKEVEEAYKTYLAVSKEKYNEYLELRNAFVKKYGSFHMSIRDGEPTVGDSLLSLLDSFSELF